MSLVKHPLLTHGIAFFLGAQLSVFNMSKSIFDISHSRVSSQTGYGVPIKGDAVGRQPPTRHADMPIRGERYEIFQPLFDTDGADENVPLIAPPREFIRTFEKRISWVDSMVVKPPGLKEKTVAEHALFMYLEMMKSFLTATVFNAAEISVSPKRPKNGTLAQTTAFDKDKRARGEDFTYVGDTMTGWKRLDNIVELLSDVVKNGVHGDYMETGVWRGGASILAKAAIGLLEPNSNRVLYVCDSFRGLPPGEKNLDPRDAAKYWTNRPYMEVSSTVVTDNFVKYGMLDSNVIFAKGFFNETMPPLSKRIRKLSVMRLDGDMYESTVDVLYHLYDKLSVGGYVIIDDWVGFPASTACEDFFEAHGINATIVPIDSKSVYWKKTKEVNVQYWRYEQSKFKP